MSATEATVASEIATTLKRAGVDRMFQLTGGDQPLWIALRDAGIRMVVGRSEPSAVYMADGFARASGRVGVTYGQAGPGAANVAAALADAHWAQSPVVALTGATATDATQAFEYQDIDQYAMFEPVTKWNGRAAEAEQVGTLLRQAIQAAVAKSPGPTHLDVPKNFFGRSVPTAPPVESLVCGAAAPDCASQVALIADAFAKAQRPVILVGEGVRFSDTGPEVSDFAVAAGVPLVATMGGKPAILSAHPNFCGIVGRYSAVTANQLLAEADCVLALGSRMGGLATNGYRLPPVSATLIQVDHDEAALVGRFVARLGVVADLRHIVPALAAHYRATGPVGRTSWLSSCVDAAAGWRHRLSAQGQEAASTGALSPVVVLNELARYASEVTLVADTGYMAAWTGVLWPVDRVDRFFRAVGSLGWALPASIGVQMARSEKVVCIAGDGGAGYHLSDIETAVRYGTPLVIIVLDNESLAFEYHEQKYRWNGNVVAEANDFGAVDFALAARALGARGETAKNRDQLRTALANAMSASGPAVVHVLVDKEAFPPVTNFDAVMTREL